MRILLTGGAGYIGSHTAVALLAADHEVVVFDNLANSDPAVLDRVSTIAGRDVPLVVGDIRDRAALEKALRDHAIDAVIHFAGLKAVGEAVAEPLKYYDNNVRGTLSLIEAMDAAVVKKLVFSSSATVYGDPMRLPLDEEHPTNPTNPYGRTKLMVEEILTDLAHADDTWRIATLRYFNPAGAHDSGLIGENPNGIPNNLMPFISRVAAGRLPELSVFGDDYDTRDGTGVRDYIHVVDLAEGHVAALDTISAQDASLSIWNLGTGEGYSVLEMVRTFTDVNKVPVPYRIVSRRPGDVATCFSRPDKAAAELGWKARRGLAEMCGSAWRFETLLRERNSQDDDPQ